VIGRRVRRVEDPRLLRGRGRYVGDIERPGILHAAFVRSPYASASVTDVDLSRARSLPGVVAAFGPQSRELPALPLLFPHPALQPVTQVPLTTEPRYVGEPVAMVLATSRYRAEDAAEAVDVSYEPGRAVASLRDALLPGAPQVHRTVAGNLAARFTQRVGDAAGALGSAPVVVRAEITIGRVSCVPMETRGLVAEWREERGEEFLEVFAATQTPHMMRRIYSELLGIPEHRIRVIAPDVGGGFGAKEPFYVEDFLVAWAARQVGRPVKWIEDRLEHMQSAVHERDQWHEATMGLTRDGRILAISDKMQANTGAYVPWGIIVPIITSTLIPGPYRVPHYLLEAEVAYTNTVPLAPYRGAGRPQAALVVNRLLDLAAAKLGLDPADIRYRNFIQPDQFPYDTGLMGRDGSPMRLDSGNYPGLLGLVLETGDYTGWRERQAAARAAGRRIGIGMAVGIENTATGPHEGAVVSVEPGGQVTVATGAASQGQAHETVLAQVVASVLDVPLGRIRVTGGDTDRILYGTGTFASRTAAVAGSAVLQAAEIVRDKALTVAARVLEAAREDLELTEGAIAVRGVPSRRITLGEVAKLAAGPFPGSTFTLPIEPGLSGQAYFRPEGAAYAAGAHLAVVEVDSDTGQIRLLAYAAAHDAGTLLNPLVVDGQVLGGVVAGLGTALWEEVRYDDQGQLLTGTFMDYLLPGPVELPEIAVAHQETPSPLNPLGVKGAGEGGTIPAPAAILAAVHDAVPEWQGPEHIPVRPDQVLSAVAPRPVTR
jgi:carbon-monoxide dehydrogenase large subunit